MGESLRGIPGEGQGLQTLSWSRGVGVGAEGERKAARPGRSKNEEALALDAGPTEDPGWRMGVWRAPGDGCKRWSLRGGGEQAHTDPSEPPGTVCFLTWGGDSEG